MSSPCHYGITTYNWISAGSLWCAKRDHSKNGFKFLGSPITAGTIPTFRNTEIRVDSHGNVISHGDSSVDRYYPTGPEAGIVCDTTYYGNSLGSVEHKTFNQTTGKYVLQLYKFDNPSSTTVSSVLTTMDLVGVVTNSWTSNKTVEYWSLSSVNHYVAGAPNGSGGYDCRYATQGYHPYKLNHAGGYKFTGNTSSASGTSSGSIEFYESNFGYRYGFITDIGDGIQSVSHTIPTKQTLHYPTSGYSGTYRQVTGLEYSLGSHILSYKYVTVTCTAGRITRVSSETTVTLAQLVEEP